MWSCLEPVSTIDESIVGEFCTNGLLRIKSEKTVVKTPNINGILQNGRLIISIDNALILYPDEKRCNDGNFVDVTHPVEAIAVSASGNIIVCGLCDGTIIGLHINGINLFSFQIDPSDAGNADGRCFAGISDEGNGNYVIQTARGSLYRVVVKEAKIEEHIAKINLEQESWSGAFPNCTSCDRLLGKQFLDPINCFILVRREESSPNPLIVAANTEMLCFYRGDNVEKVQLKPEYDGVKKMYTLMNFNFALTHSGQIIEICPMSKFFSELPYTFRIDDLVILEASANVIEMLIITKADANGRKLMKIVNFPSMELKQEMEMPEHTWLVQQPKNSANIYYIVGQTHREPVVQEFELKILSETDPSQRLVKLIKIGRLDEAEVFARQFELDVQLVHQARAKLLLLNLASGNVEDKFHKLMAALAHVNDVAFLNSIRDAPINDRNLKKRFLQFLLTKVTPAEDLTMESVIEINEQVLRIETLKLIDPLGIDQDWQQFVYHDNLPQLCTELFQKDMDAACLIWSRHIACILPQLDEVKVAALLARIPKETSPLHIVQWLLHFVGPILHHHPQMMQLLVEYIIEKAKSFQKLPSWPMVGLTFVEDVIKILADVHFPLIDDLRLQYNSNMDELHRIASALRDLVTLKQKFNLLANLDCYIDEDIESTAFRLLQITPLNLLSRIVTEFLCKFFVGKESNLYQQIVSYIRFLLNNQYSSFWDQRCITLVELLYDEQQQMETVLAILKAAPVPWPATIASLMKYAICDHPVAEEIVMAKNMQTMKCLQIKYGWSVKAPYDPRLLVLRVLKLHLPDMLVDIATIVRINPGLTFTTDLNVIAKLAEAGEAIVAAEYLDGLDEKRKVRCCRGSIGMMIRMVDGGRISTNLAMAYLETLQMLKHRADEEQQQDIQQIGHIMQLRIEFELAVDLQSLNNAADRAKLLVSGIRFILSKIRSNRDQFLDLLLGAVRRLSSYLDYNLLDSMYELMVLLDNVHMSCLLAIQLPDVTDLQQAGSFRSVHRIVSLLLAQQIRMLHEYSRCVEDPLTFPVCRELLYESRNVSGTEASIQLELLRWIQIGVRCYPIGALENKRQKRIGVPETVFNSVYEKLFQETGDSNGINGNDLCAKDKMKRESLSAFDVVNEDFDYVTVPQIQQVQEQETIIKCIGFALQLMLCRLKPETANERSREARTTFGHLLHLIMGPLQDEATVATAFQNTLDHLIRSKQYPPVLALVHLLMSYQPAIGLTIPVPYAENIYRKGIKYLLSQKEPIYDSAIMTLFTCQNRDACVEYLRTNLTNESQRVSLHTLLEFYYVTIGQEARAVEERNQLQRYTLFHELCKLDPSLKLKKSFIFHSQADLMKELKHKVIGVELLRKMSDAFSWDYQQMLVSQILTFFSQQEPSFTVCADEYGREQVLVQDKPEGMLERLAAHLAEIENAVLLCSKLTKFMEEANGYFYEQFFCIFDILAQFSELTDEIGMWRNILMFMKENLTGRRRHRPGHLEQEAWMRMHPDGEMLPDIAKYRYPFMLIVRQPLKVLLKEDIAIDNYQKLLVLVKMKSALEGLDCDEMNDYFCKSAVVNSINEYKIQNKEKSQHSECYQRKNKAFLQSILRIVDSVRDRSSKLIILYYITCNASDGEDQVNAAHACYQFARKHETELVTVPEAKEKLDKILRKYPVLKTQQLLQQSGVTEEKQFQLVRNPQELIQALYSESCFQKVKVNELVKVVGKLYDLDVEAIQTMLLQKWITIFGGSHGGAESADDFNGMLEETLYDDHNVSQGSQNDDASVQDYMKRAYYILSSWERTKSIEFLVAQLNSGADSSSDIGKQLQIYQCFSKLVDANCNPYQTFFTQQRYTALKCVHLLKSLGLNNLSIQKFEETDKMALLKMLWQSHATNPKGLEVLALICIGYNIYIPQIWNGILKQMARLGMVGHLSGLIDIVTAKRQLFAIDGFRMAWELLIKEPFRSASREQSLAEDAMLARSLVMMQKCPISSRLNLLEIADVCVNVNRVNMAAVLIGFAEHDQKEALKKLIANNAVPNLKEQIQDLEEFGLVTTVTKAVCRELSLDDVSPQQRGSKR
ncbi:kinetochore-associated protein 1 [Anopheles bellator]|uniref:kinetochore-associated protein 1 n=1 Tax=Anopheles bellator TaxID=139047 RepID=UPI00264911D9|nr:kinetochore-associated protein 1 [Anopheles bellator]